MATSGYETRLFVEQDLAAGAEIGLSESHRHYIRHVLRLAEGAGVAVFNGRNGEWLAHVRALSRHTDALAIQAQLRAQPAEPDVWLVFAPLKRARIDYLAQKASELGATCLWPVMTRNTAVSRINLNRLRANATEAAEQCGRLSVPVVRQPEPFERLVETWPPERRLFCCDETGGGQPILQAIATSAPDPAGFLIGPEGGFAETELDRLDDLANVCRVSLGARILRADTAAVAALACWQAVLDNGSGSVRGS